MPFLLLLFLTLACVPDRWPEPWAPFAALETSAALTWLGVALVVAFARAVAVRAVRRLAAHPDQRERVLRRYARLRTYHVFLLLGGYALTLYVFGWGWAVQQVFGHGGEMLPGAELVILSPFLAGLVLSWFVFYDAERALHDAADGDPSEPFWSRGAYVTFHIRQNLALVFAPLLLLLVLKGLGRLLPDSKDGPWGMAATVAGGTLSLAVFVGLPWLLRLVLGLRPLPPGPLRDRLEAAARRLNFRCSDILVWNTRGGVANAMVAGVVPWVRYVLLTDRLMSDLTPDEVEAVFGHEIGHVKHHHMLYYLGFLLVSLALLIMLCAWLMPHLPFIGPADPGPGGRSYSSHLEALPLLTMLGTYVFVVFGFLSRRCERQADVYGCRAVSCPHPECGGHREGVELAPRGRGLCPTGIRVFIEALEKVARLNGIPRERPGWLSSWQHSTIARRVDFLQQVLSDRSLERRFQRRVALVKWGLILGLVAALAAALYATGGLKHDPDRSPSAGAPELVTPHTEEHTDPSE